MDLAAALAALEHSSRLLGSILTIADSFGLIETRYAELRAANVKLKGAMMAFADHLESSMRVAG
jgi:hypothetical protein